MPWPHTHWQSIHLRTTSLIRSHSGEFVPFFKTWLARKAAKAKADVSTLYTSGALDVLSMKPRNI